MTKITIKLINPILQIRIFNQFLRKHCIWRRIHKLSGKPPPSSSPVLHINNEHIADPLLAANELDHS